LELKEINFVTRQFSFEASASKNSLFHIEYDKSKNISRSLIEEGWVDVASNPKWIIAKNDEPKENIHHFPIKEGLIKRNKWMFILFLSFLIYMTFSATIPILFFIASIFTNLSFQIVGSPMWIFTIISALLIWTIIPYAVIPLHRSNEKLSNTYISGPTSQLYTSSAEKKLKESGLIF